MAYPLILPSMAASAWFHGHVDKKGRSFEAFLEEARLFAQTDYAAALFAGTRLDSARRNRIASRLADFTGLSVKFILSEDLRVTATVFCRELLKDQGEILSRYDARYAAPGPHGPNEPAGADPIGNVQAEMAVAIAQYLRGDLGVTLEDTYQDVAPGVSARWKFDEPPVGSRLGVYENVAPFLGVAMRQNPDLRVFVAAGYYDMLTPLFSAEHTVSHAGMPLDRVQFGYYHAGHMPYLGEANLKKLSSDIRAFLTQSRAGSQGASQ